MAVQAAVETGRGRSGEKSAKGNAYVRVFDVYITVKTDDPFTAAGLPAINDAYPTDGTSVCERLTRDARGLGWGRHELRAFYRDKDELAEEQAADQQRPATGSGSGASTDPTQIPAKYFGGADTVMEAVQRDLNGFLVRNTVFDPFDPPPMVEKPRPWIGIEKNELANPFGKLGLVYHVNSGPFLIFGAREALMLPLEFEDDWYRPTPAATPVQFWRVRYKFSINRDGWNPTKIPSMGYNEKVNGKKQPIVMNGFPTSVPQPLTWDGKWTEFGEPHITEWVFYPEASFASLGL